MSRIHIHSPRRTRLAVQAMEDRCTPAAISVTYTDYDGDFVRITASKPGPIAPPLDDTDLMLSGGANGQLNALNLFDPNFDGAKIVVNAVKKPGGDGLAHVGMINAVFVDLDQVIVKGDLGKITAGSPATMQDPGLNLLQVRSMGAFGLLTGAPNLSSTVHGQLGALRVARDFANASLNVFGGVDGKIGSLFIGGDVIGGVDQYSGYIHSDDAVGKVRIGGDIVGGTAMDSGFLHLAGPVSELRIGGDVVGGSGDHSGLVLAKSLGPVRIGGNVTGGAGLFSGILLASAGIGNVQLGGDLTGGAGSISGSISSNTSMGNVRIGGDVVGGPVTISGFVSANGNLGNVLIGGDLIGGSVTGFASAHHTGMIQSAGRMASLTIRGSLVAGTDDSTGILEYSGAVVAGDDIGFIKIGGDILGNSTNTALITARGMKVKPTVGFDTAIGSLAVKGNVSFARILAGFNTSLTPVNADASIGAVTVAGDWVASSLVAGAMNLGADNAVGGTGSNADNVNFGGGFDYLQSMGDTSLVARIKSIAIGGGVYGSLTPNDHFAFVAQQVDYLKIAGQVIATAAGPSNNNIVMLFTDDVHLLEV